MSDDVVGKRIRVKMGDVWHGEIVEDRGNIGVGGRRLVTVKLDPPDSVKKQMVFELPLDDVTFDEQKEAKQEEGP